MKIINDILLNLIKNDEISIKLDKKAAELLNEVAYNALLDIRETVTDNGLKASERVEKIFCILEKAGVTGGWRDYTIELGDMTVDEICTEIRNKNK